MLHNFHHMKWFGWGDPGKEFDIDSKPALMPFIQSVLDLPSAVKLTPPVTMEETMLPEPLLKRDFIQALPEGVELYSDKKQRVLHAYGKSFRDLWRMRNGILPTVPDGVCYPRSEEEVIGILAAAAKHNVIIIPFGGGSNIAGCLEPRATRNRMVISLDMQRMNKIVSVDKQSMVAVIEPGIFGPQLEEQLNQTGVTLGHFPDSFEYSTLGGWVATRSAGMQSDKYGKIEDMIISLRLVTPEGVMTLRGVPKSSNGIDVKHLCIGSEGILGVITQVTVQVHPIPEQKVFYGYLFADFAEGVAAMQQAMREHCAPSMSRLNDIDKSALSFAYKSREGWLSSSVAMVFKWYLKYIRRMDLSRVCLMLVAFEGDKQQVWRQQKALSRVYARFGGIALGTGPGKAFEKGKYDFPYLRDFVMDRGVVADVSETSTLWSNVMPLYQKTHQAIQAALKPEEAKMWCGCHVSHSYHTGASLYFTFAFRAPAQKTLEYYDRVKRAAENAFMHNGATLSHHHAVGYEHMPWLEEDISATGIQVIKGIKRTLDPTDIMNPGKLVEL